MAIRKSLSREGDPSLVENGKLHTPDLRGVGDAYVYEGDEIDQRHVDAINANRPVVYESQVDRITKALDAVTLNKVIEQRRSAHSVGFGTLRMLGGAATAGSGTAVTQEKTLPIALKPFSDPETALHEMYGYGVLKNMGIETFEPIGVFPARKGSHQVLISEKRNDLMSLDRDTWIVGGYADDQESAKAVERNCEVVQAIAEKLGYMHVNGVFHPDGQIKNWAKTPEGEIGVIDTENLIVQGDEVSDIVSLAWHDIEKLAKSLIYSNTDDETKIFGVGMFASQPAQRVRSQLEVLLINPYLNSLLTHAVHDGVAPEVLDRADELILKVRDEFDNNPEWPGHIVASQHVIIDKIKDLVDR